MKDQKYRYLMSSTEKKWLALVIFLIIFLSVMYLIVYHNLIGIVIGFLSAIFYWLFGKIVGSIDVVVATNKSLYTKSEPVNITGNVKIGTTPVTSEPVSLTIMPTSGDAYSLTSATTDASGNFVASWQIPSDAVTGLYTLTATSKGVSKDTTFTSNSQ
jgi:hypothetical protein